MLRIPDTSWDWLSQEWFSYSTLRSFEWVYPLVLYTLPVVPLLFLLKWLFTLNTRNKLDLAMFEGKVRWQWSSVLRHIPNLVFIMFMMLVVVALARIALCWMLLAAVAIADERPGLSTTGPIAASKLVAITADGGLTAR